MYQYIYIYIFVTGSAIVNTLQFNTSPSDCKKMCMSHVYVYLCVMYMYMHMHMRIHVYVHVCICAVVYTIYVFRVQNIPGAPLSGQYAFTHHQGKGNACLHNEEKTQQKLKNIDFCSHSCKPSHLQNNVYVCN